MRLDKLLFMQMLTELLSGPYVFEYDDINGAQEATFDTTGKVYRGRKTVSAEEDLLYSISILEAPRATIGSGAGVEGEARNETWTLNIQGWPPEDRLNPSDNAYVMAAAVRERMAVLVETDRTTGDAVDPDYWRFGNRVNEVTFGSTVVVPATEGLSKVAFWYFPLVISLVQRTRAR